MALGSIFRIFSNSSPTANLSGMGANRLWLSPSLVTVHLTESSVIRIIIPMEKENYFLTQHFFKSPSEDWHRIYIQDRESRLTHILRHDLGNTYWDNYGKVLTCFVETGLLLFRAKIIVDGRLLLAQVWRSEGDALAFARQANADGSPVSILPKYGFRIEESRNHIDSQSFAQLIQETSRRPHILQYINVRWRTEDMIVGDPIKIKYGGLPFPESGI